MQALQKTDLWATDLLRNPALHQIKAGMVKKLQQAACAEKDLSRPIAYRNVPEGFLDFG